MAFFQGLVPGHFAILQAKIGLKMAKLDSFQNWFNLDHLTWSKFEGAPGGPLAKSGALNGPNWVPSKKFKICNPPFYECPQIPNFHSVADTTCVVTSAGCGGCLLA